MLLDISPLIKYRDYRLLFIGQFVSWLGNMLTYVALPYQIYHLTHSSLAVGLIGLIQLIPLLAASLWGGALADVLNRKRLLIGAEIGLAFASGLLLINSLLIHPHVWLIYVAAALSSALSGFQRPTLEAMTPGLVGREDLPAVAALNGFKYSITMIIGPASAGFIIASLGLPLVYLWDLITFIISIVAIALLKTQFSNREMSESLISSIKTGIRYAASRQELIGSYVVDMVAMIFGMPMALFPAIAEHLGGIKVLGWLYAAPSVGVFVAGALSAWTTKIKRQGAGIALAATLWGIAIIAFGFCHHIYPALIFLFIAGWADAVSGIFRTTLWAQTIPDHLRGRLSGVAMISYMSGPLLGNAEAGLVAAAFGTVFSVVSGGVLCVIGVGVSVLLLPKFWSFHSDHTLEKSES